MMTTKKSSDEVLLEVAEELLPEFSLSPGMTLHEAARGYIADHRKQMDLGTLKFFAACAIEAGLDSLAAILLGRDSGTGEKIEPA